MAFYVKNNNDFEQTEPLVRECPHCGVHAPLIPTATPGFADLDAVRPQHTGLAFRCGACSEPRFARAAIRSYGSDRIVLSTNLVEVERSKEYFQYNYLPEQARRLLREAFGCYTADLFVAFAVLAARTIAQSAAAQPAGNEPDFEQLFEDAARLGQIDAETRGTLHDALFSGTAELAIDADQAAVLIEIVKDMFQQRYVRTAKLKRAIEMRRFFAGENQQPISSLDPLAPRSGSAGR